MAIVIHIVAGSMLLLTAGVQAAAGQSIHARISSTQGYLDEVLTLQVEVKNPTQATAPTPPKSKDCEIHLSPNVANPAVSRQQFIINGRVSGSVTYTYTFDLRPLRRGRLKIPPFTLKDGGRIYRTRPIIILVKKGTGDIDLMCEVRVKRQTVYIGEPVEMTLEVWVHKYQQRDIGTLPVRVMLQLADLSTSQFGIFQDVVKQNQSYRESRRTVGNGRTYDYYVFIWEKTLYPESIGPFNFGDIAIAWNYPVKLGHDVFGSLHYVGSPRHLRAVAKLPKLEIKPIPIQGRPADFNGAVGQFSIETRAKPTQAPVGDPITLTLVIRGNVPLDRIGAPHIAQVASLTKDFEISGESLAGEIQSDRKVFSQTIRALREDVKEIPPIPMSYFDPRSGTFETAWSKAIPVTITAAKRLALPAGDGNGGGAAVLAPLVETTEGLQANFADVDVMLSDQSIRIGVGSQVLLAAFPLLYVITWIGTRRSERFRVDVAYRRRRSAYANAKKGFRHAGQSLRPHQAYGLLMNYIADRCNQPAGGLIRADAIRLLAQRQLPSQTRETLDSFLELLERAQYGGDREIGNQDLVSQSRRFLDELERYDLQ